MKNKKGFVLPAVLLLSALLLLIVPLMVRWAQDDAKLSVKDQKASSAFNLAEAALDRGYWKIKSSTATWSAMAGGAAIAGYNFDATYEDVPGGTYRIRITSGPLAAQVTIVGEGRDRDKKEVRAVMAVFENSSLPGPMLTNGNMQYAGAFEAHWGPVLAQSNIIVSGNAQTEHYPRKYSRQVVSGGSGANARDTNGLNPPNTDGEEWWSDYDVPELPVLDFAALRSSAAANGTLNYYNVNTSSSGHITPAGFTCTVICDKPTGNWSGSPRHKYHFASPECHPKAKQGLIWYWDGDLWLTGNKTSYPKIAMKGTFIVRGNLYIASGDNYTITGATVPPDAWKEYARLKTTDHDTATTNEYPADSGFQRSASTFNLGSQTWSGGPPSGNTDVGIWGFVYTGGNFTIIQGALADIYGVIWVVGNVTNDNTGERSLVFYDKSLSASLPVLNVVLTRQSWQETVPSASPWP